jgi:dihydrofolate reductase
MGKIVVSEFVSLDGVVEDPGGHERFARGGWFFDVDRGEDGARFALDEALAAEALLVGRRTFEYLAPLWPSRSGEFADRLNALAKYVVSSTLTDPGWNSSIVAGDVLDQIAALRRELRGTLLVYGSPRLVRALLEHELVDELRLIVYPVALGAGERLFGELSDAKHLRLADMRSVGDGIAIMTYEPARDRTRSLGSGRAST